MVDGDVIREVEEELRREKYKNLWDRYGIYVIGAALAIILLVGGSQAWSYWQKTRAGETGAKFEAAIKLVGENKVGEAKKALQEIASDGSGGYPTLAKLRLAGMERAAGRDGAAIKAYEAVAADSATDEIFRDFARIQAASLRSGKADWAEMEGRLKELVAKAGPWRNSARELLALAAYKAGKKSDAQRLFTEILTDRATPSAMRQRAQMMLSIIVQNAPAGKSAAGAAKTAPAPKDKPADKPKGKAGADAGKPPAKSE